MKKMRFKAGVLCIGDGLFDFPKSINAMLYKISHDLMYSEFILDGTNKLDIIDSVKRLYSKTDLLIICGGITDMDENHVLDAICKVTKSRPTIDTNMAACLYFDLGDETANQNISHFFVPDGAVILDNELYSSSLSSRINKRNKNKINTLDMDTMFCASTGQIVGGRIRGIDDKNFSLKAKIPGYYCDKGSKFICHLPGDIESALSICDNDFFNDLGKIRIGDRLRKRIRPLYNKSINIYGVPILELERHFTKSLGKRARATVSFVDMVEFVKMRVTSANLDRRVVFVDELISELHMEFDNIQFTEDNDYIEELVCAYLSKLGLKISVAESCTGGLFAAMLTSVPGASEVFDKGIIAYSNEVKNKVLGVNEHTLKTEGAASLKVAAEMAFGMRNLSMSDIAVAITGIAGPKSDGSKKRVGYVCISVKTSDNSYTQDFKFNGNRDTIRRRAVAQAFKMVLDELKRLRMQSIRMKREMAKRK